MSHFIRRVSQSIRVTRPIAAVMVEVSGKTIRVVSGSGVAILDPTKGVTLAPVPDGFEVTDGEGGAVEPSRGFWVTLETFDPYHLLVDADAAFLRG